MTTHRVRVASQWVSVAVEPDGRAFHAYTPDIPGIHADGTSEREALAAAVPLIRLYFASLAKHGATI